MRHKKSGAVHNAINVFKAPLLHFILIGGIIFACYQNSVPQSDAADETRIYVSPGRLEQISAIFQNTWQRAPTKAELEGLVDDFILEEMYYREAVAAGLDHNDTLIRRRLRQKMEFLTDGLAGGAPSDEVLLSFVQTRPEQFTAPPITTFEQIYLNPEQLTKPAEQALAEVAAQLEAGEVPVGHPTLLPVMMKEALPTQISANFGDAFNGALDEMEVGKWSGPIRTGFGFHFVRIHARTEANIPPLNDIREAVTRAWENERRSDFRERMENELLNKYEITVAWPEDQEPAG